MSTSVGEAFPAMQAHVREMLAVGKELGPVGVFYVATCEQVLREADEAMASGDPVKILRAYAAMKDIH